MITSFFTIIKFFTLHSSIISLLLCIGVLLSDFRKIKNLIFSGLLFAFCLDNAYFFLYHSNSFSAHPYISAICFSGIFLIGPMIFLFSQVSLNPEFRFSKKSFLHFVPFLISIIFSILSVYYLGVAYDTQKFGFFINKTFAVQGILGAISYAGYLTAAGFTSILYLRKHSIDFIKEPLIVLSLLLIFVFILLFLIDAISLATDKYSFLQYSSYILSACILIIFIANTVFPGFKTVAENIIEKSNARKSYLQRTDLIGLKEKIEKLTNEGVYLDSRLTLQKFAGLSGVTPHQLSEFINNHYNKNFASFINEYRIKKAKELLLSPDRYTVIAAAYDSGFNSKSAFNAAFRKSENMSPGEFRRKNNF